MFYPSINPIIPIVPININAILLLDINIIINPTITNVNDGILIYFEQGKFPLPCFNFDDNFNYATILPVNVTAPINVPR
jgi:hypothetical protein